MMNREHLNLLHLVRLWSRGRFYNIQTTTTYNDYNIQMTTTYNDNSMQRLQHTMTTACSDYSIQ